LERDCVDRHFLGLPIGALQRWLAPSPWLELDLLPRLRLRVGQILSSV